MSTISNFYKGKCVFMTGGLGLLGKQMIEKLLRSCSDIDRIYLLIRQKPNVCAASRLQAALQSKVFNPLRNSNSNFSAKLIAVPGDIEADGLGMSDSDHKEITSKVSVFIHSAATLSFTEPLKNAVKINILGTRKVLNLAKESKGVESFVHVSTAYSQVDKKFIDEKIYDAPVSPRSLIEMASMMSAEELDSITPYMLGSRPNTYTLTKAVTEKLIEEERESVPCAIIRPTIVCSSIQEPFPGWIDSISGCTAIYLGVGIGMITFMTGRTETILDVTPVDQVANTILATAWDLHRQKLANVSRLNVYNLNSGTHNPLTMARIRDSINLNTRTYRYTKTLRKPLYVVSEYDLLNRIASYLTIQLRCYIADLLLTVRRQKPRAMKQYSKVNQVQHVLEFFVINDWKWNSNNVKRMEMALSEDDKKEFPLSTAWFYWEDYLKDFWLGIKEHILKDPYHKLKQKEKKSTYLSKGVAASLIVIALIAPSVFLEF